MQKEEKMNLGAERPSFEEHYLLREAGMKDGIEQDDKNGERS